MNTPFDRVANIFGLVLELPLSPASFDHGCALVGAGVHGLNLRDPAEISSGENQTEESAAN
jgi:hypothetical protein